MKPADFKCRECGYIEEFYVNFGESFPEAIERQCSCGATAAYRIFSAVPFDIAQGRTGNAKNGYANTHVYHPSKYAPANKRGGKP